MLSKYDLLIINYIFMILFPNKVTFQRLGGFPGGSDGKESAAMWETGFDPWVGKTACRRTWQPTPVFLPGESPWTEESGTWTYLFREHNWTRNKHHVLPLWLLHFLHCAIAFIKNSLFWMGSPGNAVVKNPPANAGEARDSGFDPWVGKIPWRRKWQHTPVFLPGKSHGQRSLDGFSPWGHRVEHDWACTHLVLGVNRIYKLWAFLFVFQF